MDSKVKYMKHIHSYYSPNDLYNKIIEGLNEIGKDLSKITLVAVLAITAGLSIIFTFWATSV